MDGLEIGITLSNGLTISLLVFMLQKLFSMGREVSEIKAKVKYLERISNHAGNR